MMNKIQEWIEKHLVPVVNKITKNFWFSIVADAILYIVPFSMVSTIPSLWAILRRFVPVLPDISPLSTFSFGLIGLFVAYVIPYNCMNKIGKKDRAMIAGFTGIGTFMMCMNFETVEGGSLVGISKFGAGGMFTAIVVGLLVAAVYKAMNRFSFFSEDSVLPDFIKNWFDNIIAIILSLTVGYVFTYILKIDVFTMVQIIMKPVTGFAQSAPGVVLIVFLQNIFYFFGVSGWVFTPVTRSITQAAIAENASLVAAGMAPKKATVVILGLTFKENCPDTRNSKVVDIINRLKEYDIVPVVTDSWADPVVAKQEYSVDLVPWEDIPKADCVIVAVGHNEYRSRSMMQLKELFKAEISDEEKVLVDVKSLYRMDELKASGMRFWRL